MKTQLTTLAAAVALTISSVSFAQETDPAPLFNGSVGTIDGMNSYGPGNPTGSDSFITQTAGSDNNSTKVEQWGTQYSRITQSGDHNKAFVDQDDVVGHPTTDPGYNESIIEQVGNNNVARLTQVDKYNDSWIKQDGHNNRSEVNQDGEWNDSYINTDGDYNKDYVTQNGDELDSYILTQGNRNTNNIYQEGYGHDSFVHTVGSYNTQNVTQLGSFTGGQHFSQILTYGDGNTNTVLQGN